MPHLRFSAVLLALIACSAPTERSFKKEAPVPALAVSVLTTTGASGEPLLPEQAAFDVRHVDLDLWVDPASKTIAGGMSLTADVLSPLRRLVLHLDHHLSVDTVSVRRDLDLSPSPELVSDFRHQDGLITADLKDILQPGETLLAHVEYGGSPRVAPRPPWDGGFTWARTEDGQPWIATSCQGEGADLWWPCKDHPSDKPETMDLHITVPAGLTCATNGTLRKQETLDVEIERPEGRREERWSRWHWEVASPISNYAVALNIAPYVELREEYTSIDGTVFPLIFWVLPEHEEQGRAFLPEIRDHMDFFEETLGPYPFRAEKYGVVETPHLGMEHQTIIAYGNQFRRRGFDYDWLHHHEASHEWWGNLVTCSDWKDMWIHESFGTYMQALYLEERFGEEAYFQKMAQDRRGLKNEKPVAPYERHDSHQIYFTLTGSNNDIYSKGSWVLHTLRWLVGEETFPLILKRFAYPTPSHESAKDGSQVRLVDTDDFIELVSNIVATDLSWFFDVYVRQPELPQLLWETEGDTLRLQWKVPGNSPFPLPVPVSIDDQIRVVDMDENSGEVSLRGASSWEVDPQKWLLREENAP